MADRLWINARVATMGDDGLGIIERGAVAAEGGRIGFVGPQADAPTGACETMDCEGRWITPGLIDCHTHLVHAGTRAAEWRMRLAGARYDEIAAAGGGIVSTVQAVRAASEADLVAASLPRLDAMLADGVTTVEIKSGYGLSLDDELRMLRAAKALAAARPVRVAATFLGAHSVPPEYKGRADDYVALVCDAMIPAVAGLADAVDVYCDTVGFTPAQTERVLVAAKAAGLPVKIHAEQLSDQHGAALAARYGALSADHLEHLGADGIAAMAAAGSVAVLLPGAYYFLRDETKPPVAALVAAGVPLAVATDCNPGTSPLTSLRLAMNMAATLFGLTVEQCWLGVTRHAVRALGLSGRVGTLEVGKDCDLAIWSVETLAEVPYHMGMSPLHARVFQGHMFQGNGR